MLASFASLLSDERLVAVVLFVGLVAGCASTSTERSAETMTPSPLASEELADTPVPPSTVARGLDVYRQQYCGICHRLGTADTRGAFGPPHDGMGAIAGQRIQEAGYTGAAATAEAYIRESIVDPDIYFVPGYEGTTHHMPAYTTLSEEDLNAVVQMLLREEGE